MNSSVIIIIVAALMVAYAIYGTVRKAQGKAKASCCGSGEVVIKHKVDDTDPSHYPFEYRLKIDGMACSNCARTVENTLNAMEGVWARVNLGKHEATVLTKTERNAADFTEAMQATSYKITDCAAVPHTA